MGTSVRARAFTGREGTERVEEKVREEEKAREEKPRVGVF